MSLDDPLLNSLLDVLTDGPKSLEDIIHVLEENRESCNDDGLEERLIDIIENSDLIWDTVAGLYGRSDRLLEGVYLTHRLTKREIDSGLVDIVPDLEGLDLGLDQITLVGGGTLEEVHPFVDDDLDNAVDDAFDSSYAEHSYSGPPGWLTQFSPGDLIGFHRIEDAVEVLAPGKIADAVPEKTALSEAFDALSFAIGDVGFEAMDVLLEALCANPLLFHQPVAPLQELLEDIGLEINGTFVESVDPDREISTEASLATALGELLEQYSFESCCLEHFGIVSAALEAWRAGELKQSDFRTVAQSLSHGPVAPAFVTWVIQFDLLLPSSVDDFMTQLTAFKRSPVAAVYFVRSIVRSLQGKALLAEQDIRTALQYDPNYEPAQLEWAIFAADRGEILTFISRLKQCESELAERELQIAMDFLPRYPPTERNASCPCGSGRKYKSCCLMTPKLTSTDAQNWIIQRVLFWMVRPERRSRFTSYFEFVASRLADLDNPEVDPLVVDAILFEGGGFTQYLEMKKELLSKQDRELLEALVESHRTLFEVTNVVPGESLTLLDLLGGETVTVIEHLGSLETKIGEYRLGRLINASDGPVWFGPGIKIGLNNRQSTLDFLKSGYEVFDLLNWIVAMFQPPVMQNFDGEDIVFTRARVKPSENVDIRTVMGEAFEETSPNHWSQTKESSKGGSVSSASIRYEDGELTLEANSVERVNRLLETLQGLLGDFEILERTEQSAKSTIRNRSEIPVGKKTNLPPEAIEALEAYLEELENKWLDERIPALGGLTPREAAADPKKKGDLLRLLNEFEQSEIPEDLDTGSPAATFKASRIRAKLGL